MKMRVIFALVIITLMLIGGCGGSSGEKSATQNIVFAVTLAEGNFLVEGTVYNDANDSGTMDSTETGVAGVTVTLSGTVDALTDAAGYYAFAITTTGPYTVDITEPAGYILTTTSPVDITVTDADVQVDFGLYMYMDFPVDVKPGSNVNPVNLRSKGVLPVAVLGSADLDVTRIDPATILLNNVPPLRWSIEDVCGPMPGPADTMAEEHDDMETPDGYDDLALKFDSQAIAAAITAALGEPARGDIVTLYLYGETFDGTILTGEEDVLIVQVPR